MNILIIYNKYLYYGGEDTYFEKIQKLLKKNGHTIFTYTEDSKRIGSSFMRKVGISLNLIYNPTVKHKLDAIIGSKKIDAALVLNIYPLIGSTVYWELKRRKIRIIQRIANYRYLCPKTSLFRNGKICEECPISASIIPSVIHSCYQNSAVASLAFALAFRFHTLLGTLNLIHAFILPSSFVAKKHILYGAIPKKKTHILPTFYDPFIHKKRVKRVGVIYAGRLVAEKGVMFLLNAASFIPKIPITIVGEGPLKNEVVSFAKINKNIVYIPFLDKQRLLSLIAQHKALVLPALWYDVLPNIVLEAFSINTPVIAPRHGVFQSIITHNKTGVLYKKNNTLALINAIKSTIRSKISYNPYFQREREKYSSEKHYNGLITLFRKGNK